MASFFLFFSIVLSVIIGSHAFVYFSIAHFFGLEWFARRWLLLAVFALSASFFVASIIAHWHDNVLTRGFYWLSATWLGVLSNLFFLLVFAWIVYGLARLSGVTVPANVLGIGVVVCTILLSAYGLYQADNIGVRREVVYIKDLPAAWEGRRLVQVTDVHLGHIIRAPFAARVAQAINAENPAVVAVVGDLFDGMDGHLEWLLEPFNAIRSTYGTHFITGNHETYLGTGKTLDIVAKTNIHTIDDRLVDLAWLQLIGVASPERRQERNLSGVLTKVGFDRTKPSILLYHTPTLIDTAKSLGISLQLAGHTHLGQLYPFNLLTHLEFRGYDFGIYREGDYTLSVSSGVGTWWPPMRTNSRAEIVSIELRRAGK